MMLNKIYNGVLNKKIYNSIQYLCNESIKKIIIYSNFFIYTVPKEKKRKIKHN